MDVNESGYLFRYGVESDPRFKHKVATFEKEFAEYIGVKHAIAVNSGTAAILTCLFALGIGPGDEVIVPGYGFIATYAAICYARAIPVLAEIDESLNIDPLDIERKITKKTRAILPIHMLGNPCDMGRIMEIAKKYNLYVIEDCCQGNGGSYKGKKLGSFGDINAFSLQFNKTITSGDGGVITTNNDQLYEKAFGIHDQGHKPLRIKPDDGSLIGLNFRMNELTGAVALAQVRKMDKLIAMLREKKHKLKSAISGIPEIDFRKLNDEQGDCATLLTLLFKDNDTARKFVEKIGEKTLDQTGVHVYNHMDQLLGKNMPTAINCPFSCNYYGKQIEYKPNMLPQTDNILGRAVNISIGVVDKGIGAGFGINIQSTNEDIKKVTEKIKAIAEELGDNDLFEC